MNRSQALVRARAAKASYRDRDDAIRREVLSLRTQVGEQLSKSLGPGSGINLQLHRIIEEYVPELFTLSSRLPILERMSYDPVVRGQLNAIGTTLMSGVRWKVVGGTSEQQDFLAANLLREGDRRFWCQTSWIDRLYETLSCMIFGFAMFGKRWEEVDGRTVLRELKWLHPRSLRPGYPWNMDEHDNLLGVNRLYRNALGQTVLETIDVQDLFIVPWDRRGPNWEGHAFIRPMYKPWKMRELAEKIDLIDLQNRGVGIPLAKLGGSGTGAAKERDTLMQMVKNLRGGSKERAFLVIDKDEDVQFLTSQGNVRDAQQVLDGKAADIARVSVLQYLEQGNTGTGSRAAASALSTGFFILVDTIRIILTDIINFGAGPLPGLCEEIQDYNFAGAKEYAHIEGSRVSPTEQLDNIPIILDSVKSGAVPRSMKLSNWITDRLGAPVLTQEEYDQSVGGRSTVDVGTPSGQPEATGTTTPAQAAGRPVEAPNSTRPQDPRKDGMSRRLGLLEEKKNPRRGPTDEEKRILSLAEIDAGLKREEAAYAAVIHGFQTKEIERIGALISEGRVNSLDLAKSASYGGLFGYRNQMRQRLLEVAGRAVNFGRGQVNAELKRQAR